jgi:hypothetical protein
MDRPLALLVSTTRHSETIRDALGAAAYSYHFVAEALAPALERVGSWTLVDRPASRLAWAARDAARAGFRPVHLSINPLQDAYLAPGMPNVVFPFWEFPRIPDRALGHDSSQDWSRVATQADLILCASTSTAEAFRASPAGRPTAVMPVPVPAWTTDLPPWESKTRVTIECRHCTLGGENVVGPAVEPAPPSAEPEPPRGWRSALQHRARSAFRRIEPRLDPRLVRNLCLLKRELVGQPPSRIALRAARGLYNRALRGWLSDAAVARVTLARTRALERLGIASTQPIDPVLPTRPLPLGGLTYTTFLSVGDARKNDRDILSAFLLAFRDRPDVTLVIKLATSRSREHHELGVLRRRHEALGIAHRCRVAVITDYLDESQLRALYRATTFYVNASRAEGACLPLQQALAAGRPAIAPDHTAMADYIDEEVALVVGSSPEPCPWPHDPEQRLETDWYRIDWGQLHGYFLAGARMVAERTATYRAMADAARSRMQAFASIDRSADRLRDALGRILAQNWK